MRPRSAPTDRGPAPAFLPVARTVPLWPAMAQVARLLPFFTAITAPPPVPVAPIAEMSPALRVAGSVTERASTEG